MGVKMKTGDSECFFWRAHGPDHLWSNVQQTVCHGFSTLEEIGKFYLEINVAILMSHYELFLASLQPFCASDD